MNETSLKGQVTVVETSVKDQSDTDTAQVTNQNGGRHDHELDLYYLWTTEKL